MQLSNETILAILERTVDCFDYAEEYGEPGYSFSTFADTPIAVFADYWCRCGRCPFAGLPKPWAASGVYEPKDLHSFDAHHPRIWKQMKDQGVVFDWIDEWVVDGGKAYRTEPDSYSWTPSFIYDDGGLLTPDDDIETWIEWAKNDPERAILPNAYRGHDLIGAGFKQHNGQFESGFHPGQNDDPKKITAAIRHYDDGCDIVFAVDSVGQFDAAFSAYTRPTQEED